MEGLAQKKAGIIRQAASGFQGSDFLQENLRIQNDPISNNAPLARMQYSGRNKMENHFLIPDNEGMPRIISALETDYVVSIFGKNINDLAFSFIAPLGSDYNNIRHS
jgi:hypothetical protein